MQTSGAHSRKVGNDEDVVGDDVLQRSSSRSKAVGPAEVFTHIDSASSSSESDADATAPSSPDTLIRDQRLVRCAHTIIRVAPLFTKPTVCNLCRHHLWVWQGQVRTCTRCEIYLHEVCFQELVVGLALVAEGKVPEAAFRDARDQFEPVQEAAPLTVAQPLPPTFTPSPLVTSSASASQADFTGATPDEGGGSFTQPQWFGALGVSQGNNPAALAPESSMVSAGLSRFMSAARSALAPVAQPSPSLTLDKPPTPPPTPETTDDDASPLSTTTRFAHVHDLLSRTAYLPTLCSVCGYVLVGPCYCCKGCDYTLHLGCLPTIPTSEQYDVVAVERSVVVEAASSGTIEEYRDRSAEPTSAYEESDPQRDALLGDALDLVKNFHKRNSTWHAALNPMRMKSIYDSHADIYGAAIESLHRLRDATGALLASGDLEVDGSVAATVRSSGITHLELTTSYHILRYATAMYGMAYSEGYMSSVGKATVMRVFRRNYLAPKDELNNVAVMDVLALPRNDLKYSRLSNKVLEPSYGLIQDRQAKGLVLAFRGSLTDADFLSDACGNAVSFCGGVAHEGMAKMAKMAAEDVGLMNEIRRIMDKRPEYKLYITGHSLGAGLATLFTIYVRHNKLLDEALLSKRTHTFCFAPPPSVTVPLADNYDSSITSFVAGDDVVCRLQLNTIDRLAGQAGESGHPDTGALVGSGNDVGDLTEELHITGTVYFMTDPLGKKNKLVRVRRTHTILHQIFLSPSMITSHLMDSYASGLRQFVDAVVAEEANVDMLVEMPLSPTAAALVKLHAE